VTVVLGFLAGAMFSSGVWLIVTDWRRSGRRVGDQVEEWLRGR